jgi:hypothetical protein
MSFSEYAKHRAARGLSGTTQGRVSQAVQMGFISTVDGKIDPDKADAEWQANTRQKAKSATPRDPDKKSNFASWSETRLKSEQASAALKVQELQRRSGRLVDREGVERAAMQVARSLRDAIITGVPTKYGRELFAIEDYDQFEARLQEVLTASVTDVIDLTGVELG